MIKEPSELLGEAIRANGYNGISFPDPFAALEVIKKHHEQYSLVILDYKRYHNRMWICWKIAEIDNTIKLIVIREYDEIVDNTLKVDVFAKPIKVSNLIEIVEYPYGLYPRRKDCIVKG